VIHKHIAERNRTPSNKHRQYVYRHLQCTVICTSVLTTQHHKLHCMANTAQQRKWLRETRLWKCCYTLTELRVYVPIDTKTDVIFFRDILPSQYISTIPKKLDLTQQKQICTNKPKYTNEQNKPTNKARLGCFVQHIALKQSMDILTALGPA